MSRIDVSVIIVNYNTMQMTNECIESVLSFTNYNTIEVIVVDNASTDGSQNFYQNDKRINYIYSNENLGFGRANNIGIRAATGKYVFMLNSDTLFLDDVIKKLYDFAEKHIQFNLGAIGTCMVDRSNNDTLSFGQFLTPQRIYRKLFENLGFFKEAFEAKIYLQIKNNGYSRVDYISGADLFAPKRVLDQINGFDPEFFMYYEETDMEKRMEKVGLKRYIINVRDIVHFEGGSFGYSLPFARKLLMIKGMKIYINKHFKGIAKIHIIILSCLVLLKDLRKLNYTIDQNITLIREIFKKG